MFWDGFQAQLEKQAANTVRGILRSVQKISPTKAIPAAIKPGIVSPAAHMPGLKVAGMVGKLRKVLKDAPTLNYKTMFKKIPESPHALDYKAMKPKISPPEHALDYSKMPQAAPEVAPDPHQAARMLQQKKTTTPKSYWEEALKEKK